MVFCILPSFQCGCMPFELSDKTDKMKACFSDVGNVVVYF